MHRQTLKAPATIQGTTLHTGATTTVTLHPAKAGSGLTLTRTGQGGGAFGQLNATMVQPQPLATVVKNADGITVSTLEHLLAACAGLSLTDIHIEVDGPELPILDGSALPWVNLIDSVGRIALESSIQPLTVTKPLTIEENTRSLAATPADHWRLNVTTTFDHPKIGTQTFGGQLTEEWFRTEVAPARTFVLERDLKVAQSYGMAKGATLAGGVLFADDGTVANPEGLRFPDEPVRHKLLDAIGDLYLMGRPWHGAFDLTAPGHAATNKFLRQLLGQ